MAGGFSRRDLTRGTGANTAEQAMIFDLSSPRNSRREVHFIGIPSLGPIAKFKIPKAIDGGVVRARAERKSATGAYSSGEGVMSQPTVSSSTRSSATSEM